MKKLKAVLIVLIIPLILIFCACNNGTELSKLTGVSADDIEGIGYHYIAQSYAQSIKESCYSEFFSSVNVRYEENSSFDYGNDTICYNVTLKDKKRLYMYYSSDKKMYIDYFDGENNFYYVSCDKVYIPLSAVQPE